MATKGNRATRIRHEVEADLKKEERAIEVWAQEQERAIRVWAEKEKKAISAAVETEGRAAGTEANHSPHAGDGSRDVSPTRKRRMSRE